GPGDMDEEALKRFLKGTFGDALPEGALDGLDLSALAQQANLPQDPAQLRAAAAQMQNMFAAQGDSPGNWDMAEDIARRTAVGQVAGLGDAGRWLSGGSVVAMRERVGGEVYGVQFGLAIGVLRRGPVVSPRLAVPGGRAGWPALPAAKLEVLIAADWLGPGAT